MTTKATLYGLDRPDEELDLNLKNADPKEIFKTTYKVWSDLIQDVEEDGIPYKEACRITRPYVERLVDMLKEKHPFQISDGNIENEDAGIFLSAACNQSSRKEIVCNLEMDLWNLAYKLPKDKMFINHGKAGNWMAWNAEGIVINYGKVGDWMGCDAKGTIINYGEARNEMGWDAKGMVINYGEAGNDMGWDAKGMVINYGEAGNWMGHGAEGIIIAIKNPEGFDTSNAKLVLKKKDCKRIPEFIEYFDGLKVILDKGKTDHKALSKLLEGRKVTDDVEDILRKRGLLK